MRKAFTLVELIVVIAIIAILAAGLLAGLDPMEQIAKAQDTSAQAAMRELKSSLDRFLVTRGHFPGQAENWTPNDIIFSSLNHQTYFGASAQHIMSRAGFTGFSDTGDLKPALVKTLTKKRDDIYIMPTSTGGSSGSIDGVIVCMKPKSKQFKLQAVYTATVGEIANPPVANSTCPIPGSCYLCLE